MPAHAPTARGTLRLPDSGDEPPIPVWAVFDPDWYRKRYPDAPTDGSDEELLEWHLHSGPGRLGQSPNRYFDEQWQRQAWPGIVALIEAGSVASAFDAWCRGAHVTQPPHWLFDPGEYRGRYPALTDDVLAETGFVNLYHHYLRFRRGGRPDRTCPVRSGDLSRLARSVGVASRRRNAVPALSAWPRNRRAGTPDLALVRSGLVSRTLPGSGARGRFRAIPLRSWSTICGTIRPTEFDPSPVVSPRPIIWRKIPASLERDRPRGFP